MAKAFKCDKCDNYEDGSPHPRMGMKDEGGSMGWVTIEHQAELCEGCAEEFDTAIPHLIGVDDAEAVEIPELDGETETIAETESFEEIVDAARASQYHTIAALLEHYASPDPTERGPVYHPFAAPPETHEAAKSVLWAVRAGRAFERDYLRGRSVSPGGADE